MHPLRSTLLAPILALWPPGVVARVGDPVAWLDAELEEAAADAELHRLGDDVDRLAALDGVDLLIVAAAPRAAIAARALEAVWAGDMRSPALALVFGTVDGVADAVEEARAGLAQTIELRSIPAFGGVLLLHDGAAPLTPAQRDLLDDWRLGPGPRALVDALEVARSAAASAASHEPAAAGAPVSPPPPEADPDDQIAALERRIRELAEARARLEAEALTRESRLELLRAELAVLHRLVDATSPAA